MVPRIVSIMLRQFFEKSKFIRFFIFTSVAFLIYCSLALKWYVPRRDTVIAVEVVENVLDRRRPFSGTDENFCHLPNLKPFDDAISKYVFKAEDIDCTRDTESHYPLLFQISTNGTLVAEKHYSSQNYRFESCCYLPFNPRNNLIYSDSCIEIKTPQALLPGTEYIAIYCVQREDFEANATLPQLVDMLHHIPIKEKIETTIEAKVEERSRSSQGETPQVNVIIFGIDAVSHLNFRRTMPRSRDFLVNTLSAQYLNGYTKVGDNTFPNLVPVLTGLAVSELTLECWPTKDSYFDSCPFIWKNFSTAGYRTGFSEDAIWMGIFNYLKKGFEVPPTDYFFHDFMRSAEDNIGQLKRLNAKLCYGPRLGFNVLLDNLEKMVVQMGKDRRYFQFTWSTSISHDFLNYPGIVDTDLLTSLDFLNSNGFLNNTVLLIMSDHGMRFGRIRSTFQGKIEESMPFLYAVFPPWFKLRYTNALNNFIQNRQKLTTPFDLHETLTDLLDLDQIQNDKIQQREKMLRRNPPPRGLSLFLEIPENRTCELAAIPQTYCVCHAMKPISVESTVVSSAVTAAIAKLNADLELFSQCKQLTLDVILSAHSVILRENITELANKKPEEYLVTFQTTPGRAIFEATLISQGISSDEDATWMVAGDISRINEYGLQSHCVTDYNILLL